MRVQVEIQAVRERVHQRPQPRWTGGVFGLQVGGIDEEFHPQVAVDFALALDLREPAQGVDVVQLDPVEIILGLREEQPKDGVGVRPAVDMGHAPMVADEGDVAGPLLPAGEVIGAGRDRSAEDKKQCE